MLAIVATKDGNDFWQKLDQLLASSNLIVDRPRGSLHPRYAAFAYPLDYGYLEGTRAGDGEGIDVWIGSLPAGGVTGVLCTIDLAKRDAEVKLLVGCTACEAQEIVAIHQVGLQAAILIERPPRPQQICLRDPTKEAEKAKGQMNEDLFRGGLVRLAAAQEDDVALFARWSQDADYLRALDTDYARPLSAKEVEERFSSTGSGPNAVEFRLRTLEGDRLIGFVALHSIEWNNQTAMLSIGIGDPDYRGKGYGTDALRLALRYAFRELNLYRVGLDVIADNQAAIRAYEKVGFKREGAMRGAVLRDGQRKDLVLMGILRQEWQAAVDTSDLKEEGAK